MGAEKLNEVTWDDIGEYGCGQHFVYLYFVDTGCGKSSLDLSTKGQGIFSKQLCHTDLQSYPCPNVRHIKSKVHFIYIQKNP